VASGPAWYPPGARGTTARREGSAMPPPDVTLRLARPEPLDLLATVRFLRIGSADPTCRFEPGLAVRAVHTPDGPVTLEVADDGDALAVRAWGPGAGRAAALAADLVGTADDPDDFAPDHAGLRRLAAKWRGLRLARGAGALDALVPTVFQQLVTWDEAAASWRRALRDLGDAAPGPHGLLLPPDADRLRVEPTWRWERAGLNRRRAATLRAIGETARRLEEVVGDLAAARARWAAVPGIGPWTIEHALAVRLGVADAVILGDSSLASTVAFALTGEERGDDPQMEALLAPFRPHRFRVVRLLWAEGVKAPRRAPKRPIRGPWG
jgi:3-methyladenine DNA glycosylase/8-oxoguanine DNA glycosylase